MAGMRTLSTCVFPTPLSPLHSFPLITLIPLVFSLFSAYLCLLVRLPFCNHHLVFNCLLAFCSLVLVSCSSQVKASLVLFSPVLWMVLYPCGFVFQFVDYSCFLGCSNTFCLYAQAPGFCVILTTLNSLQFLSLRSCLPATCHLHYLFTPVSGTSGGFGLPHSLEGIRSPVITADGSGVGL